MSDASRFPVAADSRHYPVHNWFHFVAGFSPDYVRTVIADFENSHQHLPEKIYDPFCGGATTCIVANEFGILSIGVERNPFFHRIACAKAHANKTLCFLPEIRQEFLEILQTSRKETMAQPALSADARTYLDKLFSPDVLQDLLLLRETVFFYLDDKFYMAFALLSKMMEFCTTASTDGIYKAPSTRKKALSVKEALEKSCQIMQGAADCPPSLSKIVFDSSITWKPEKESVDLVIFSPPYLNNFDFAEMSRMYLYFWQDAACWKDISEKHRNHMLINTTTALHPVQDEAIQNQMRQQLPPKVQAAIDPVIAQLKAIKTENPKKKPYWKIIAPYLFQMQQVIQNCFYAMKEDGEMHIILSNAAFYAVSLETQQYVADILEAAGFEDIQITTLRTRGSRWKLDKRKSGLHPLAEFEIRARKP